MKCLILYDNYITVSVNVISPRERMSEVMVCGFEEGDGEKTDNFPFSC